MKKELTEDELAEQTQACLDDLYDLFYLKKYSKSVTAIAMSIVLSVLEEEGIKIDIGAIKKTLKEFES